MFTLLLMLCLIFPLFPVSTATAAEPFAVTGIITSSNRTGAEFANVTVPVGGVISPNSTGIKIGLTHAVTDQAALRPRVTVQDSAGQVPGLNLNFSSYKTLSFTLDSGFLKKNETYTVTIKGDPKPVLEGGVAIPNDVVVTFKTDDAPYYKMQSLQNGTYPTLPSMTLLPFEAEAGPFVFQILTEWQNNDEWTRTVKATVTDEATGETVADETYQQGGVHKLNLPHSGRFVLTVAVISTEMEGGVAVNIGANELQLDDTYIPRLTTSLGKGFQLYDKARDITSLIKPDAGVKQLHVYIDEEPYMENILNADRTVKKVVIDPAKLKDGLHTLGIVADSKTSDNVGGSVVGFYSEGHQTFTDIPRKHWASRQVEILNMIGAVNGRTSTTFVPDAKVTREEFATMAAKTLGITATRPSPFYDVGPKRWAKPYIAAMAEKKWIVGEKVGSYMYFYPDRYISRAEAATILGRIHEIANLSANWSYYQSYSDFKTVPAWAQPSVAILTYNKWLNGQGDGKFHPNDNLSRAEAAAMLYKFLQF